MLILLKRFPYRPYTADVLDVELVDEPVDEAVDELDPVVEVDALASCDRML
jgi:hypothetical protein